MPTERAHRLSPECYRGRVAVAFTACLRLPSGARVDDELADLVRTKLTGAAAKYCCAVAAWCLMPDHLHVILTGLADDADTWRAVVDFKQQTGFWLARNRPAITWQKDFYDHVIRSDESLDVQVRYVVENPVRAGLVADWTVYPWAGGELVDAMRDTCGDARILSPPTPPTSTGLSFTVAGQATPDPTLWGWPTNRTGSAPACRPPGTPTSARPTWGATGATPSHAGSRPGSRPKPPQK